MGAVALSTRVMTTILITCFRMVGSVVFGSSFNDALQTLTMYESVDPTVNASLLRDFSTLASATTTVSEAGDSQSGYDSKDFSTSLSQINECFEQSRDFAKELVLMPELAQRKCQCLVM